MPAECQVNNIDIDLIYSNTIEENIISINTKKELFFDVYECAINDQKLVLEKVGDSELGPKVLLEINIEGKKYSAEAILVDNGSTYVELNKENIYFIRTIPDENLTIKESEVEDREVEDKTSNNVEVNYENIIEHHVNNKLVFLHELEEQFEEKIVSLKDDISNKLDLFFEKLEDKKKVIVEEKLEKITADLNEKFIVLQSELQGVEDFSKKNIDNILETKINEIDSSISLFLDGITKEYTNKIISSDKKITHNFLELNSIKEKLKENNSTTNKKFEDLNSLKEKLLEQDELVLKNEELKKFINEEFKGIDSKFKNLSQEESKKYDELLAAFNNKDVVEYKTILKEKIQDVELTQIKESLQEEISSALKGDIVSLKRYVEMSSGGGSVAKQFAAGGTMDGTLNVNGNILSGGRNLDDIFSTETAAPCAQDLQSVTNIGSTTTNLISSNNIIIADTILATNLLSATNLDIGFELSGFNITGSLSASGNISSGSLTTPALSTDGIDTEFIGTVSGITQSMVGLANVCNTSDASKPVSTAQQSALNLKANLTSPIFIDSVTVVGNLSASGNLSGANIVGNNVFSGGLAVCTSVPAQTIPTLQAVTNEGNSTTGSIGIGVTSPTAKLHVKASSAGNVLRQLRLHNDFTAAGTGAGIAFTNSTSETFVNASIDSVRATSIANGNLVFSTRADTTGDDNAVIERMRINPTGEVGINTAPVDGIDLNTRSLSSLSLSANNVFSGGLAVCTSVPAQTIPSLQQVTTQGNTTTNSLSIGDLSAGKIIGGFTNRATGVNAAVVGGTSNTASGAKSSIGGGTGNTASGTYSNIAGGASNTASGNQSNIGGGQSNAATGYQATVAGGIAATAGGSRSTVGGGYRNYATGPYTTIAGGNYARATGNNAFIGGGYYQLASGNFSTIGGGLYGQATGMYAVIGGGSANRALASCSTVGGGRVNCINAPAIDSVIAGGKNNTVGSGSLAFGCRSFIGGGNLNHICAADSGILGGISNRVLSAHAASFIIGTGITSSAACTTFVNNLSSQGIINSCVMTSEQGVKVGGGSIFTCTGSFSPSLSDNGKTLLLDTTSGSIVVSVTPQISGFATRYIKEAGAAPVVFSTGPGLSGLYSYQDRNQMSIIYAQADIFFKSDNYAFLGGNLQ